MTFGDPRYMSPEQARGDRIDRRADIYQLGCVAYEALTGAPPFTGNRVFDILTKQVTEIPAPLPTRRPGVPLWMEAAVAKMLAKDPENRFATTTRMIEALRRGLETGQVMEDDVARRRESIPPPSVSRVMEKMGMSSPAETPRDHAPQRELPPLPAYAPAAQNPIPVPPPAKSPLSQTVGPIPVPPPAKPTSAPVPAPAAKSAKTSQYASQFGPPEMPPPLGAPAPVPAPAPPAPAPAPAAPLPSAAVTLPPTEAAPRRRTGTPQVGVPAVPEVQPPVAGQIDAPSGRTKAPTKDPMGISQAWYDDGDRASADAESSRPRRAGSASTTDLSLYDESAVKKKRWPLVAGALGLLVIVGGAIALAMNGGGSEKPKARPAEVASAVQPAPVAPPANVPPSQIIADPGSGSASDSGSGSATTAKDPPKVAEKTNPPAPPPHETHAARSDHGGRDHGRSTSDVGFDDDPSARRPTGLGDSTPKHTEPTGPVIVQVPTGRNSGKSSGPSGVSGADGPQDPYASAGPSDPGDGAPPEKKAEFYANLGTQQLGNGDTAGAAASFKRASELDPKNVNAVIGMGDIALRQGLFGDAIAHLRKAAKMAPRNSRVFTLLGEAYLNAGQNAVAAENFKKALQLDPDNAQARDGYNEASSRVPPPSDDE